MKRFVIGNWKCHKTLADARSWFEEFARLYLPIPEVSVILAPSFVCMESISEYVRRLNLKDVFLAAQDISPFPKGAYTGAVAADMVKGMVGLCDCRAFGSQALFSRDLTGCRQQD